MFWTSLICKAHAGDRGKYRDEQTILSQIYTLVRERTKRCVVGNFSMYLMVVHQDSFILMIKKIILKSIFCLFYHLKCTFLVLFKREILLCHRYVCATMMVLTIIITYHILLLSWWTNNSVSALSWVQWLAKNPDYKSNGDP